MQVSAVPDLLTTDEAAAYLRLSERKLYEMVAEEAIPCTKLTGRWLFPRDALDAWLRSSLVWPKGVVAEALPAIFGGTHDPLIEWALRESASGLAFLPEGSEPGLDRLARGEIMMAGIHFHNEDGDDEAANIEALRARRDLHDAVLIGFARREQGLIVATDNPLGLTSVESLVSAGARVALRPRGAGAHMLLERLLSAAGTSLAALARAEGVARTGHDIAHAIRRGTADCGVASRAVAVTAGLDFVPLAWERLDLALRQRSYFSDEVQRLIRFFGNDALAMRARELEGYDLTELGAVRFVA